MKVSLRGKLRDGNSLRRKVMHNRISKLLGMYPYLKSRAYYNADLDSLDTVIDLDRAIERANLDKDETNVLNCIYMRDMTQAMAVEELGLTRDIVRYNTKKVLTKVGKAYYNID